MDSGDLQRRLFPRALSTSLISIGNDLSSEILKRLTPKSLCRLRCVCKSWNSLISSAPFINLHRSFSSSSVSPNLRSKLSPNLRSKQAYIESSIVYDIRFPFLSRHDDSKDDADLCFRCVDVINGVVCVSSSDSTTIILWNPAIRKCVDLPRYISRLDSCAIGFGYHNSQNDFKLVRIRIPCFAYEVYSTRHGLWTAGTAASIDIIKSYRFHSTRSAGRAGRFVNGILHWLVIALDCQKHGLLMFDCEHEEFAMMELPEGITTGVWELELIKHSGKLSVLVRSDHIAIALWVMGEHGVATSWKKLYESSNNDFPTYLYIPTFLMLLWMDDKFEMLLSRHVYDQSLYLMDHPKALSYLPKDEVSLDIIRYL